MLNLKKTAVAVLALGSSAVFAGTMGPVCTPGNVTVPCEATGWDVGVYALYYQPLTDGRWAYHSVTTPNVNVLHDFEPKWDWGFALEGSYHFNTGNDFTVTWSRIDVDHSGTYIGGTTVPVLGDNFTVNHNWNQVDMAMGQFVDFSANKKMRFHGGLTYSSIERSVSDFFSTTGLFRQGDNSKFSGWGPRTGLDMMYVFGNGFGVHAKAAASLLVGSSSFTSGIAPVLGSGTLTGSADAIVPELEGTLGVDYTYPMASGELRLDLSYDVRDYFDALTNRSRALSPAQVSNIFTTNYGLQGIKFGLNYKGNV